MKPSPVSVPDRNYREWFSGSDIFQNVRETIRSVQIPLAHIGMEHDDSLSMSVDASFENMFEFEDMFQLAPSCIAGKEHKKLPTFWLSAYDTVLMRKYNPQTNNVKPYSYIKI